MKMFGPYSIQRRIGEGGNGEVFLAKTDESEVALKVLRPKDRVRPDALQRFKSEIAVLWKLLGTPGVMPILANGQTKERPWFAMPVAEPLRDALKDAALHDIVKAFASFAKTLNGLAAKDIYHRDIKPENLFRLPPDNWVIGDFGIHKGPENPVLTKDGRKIGPALYSAQEMLDYKNDEDHSRADVFSLAKTFWVIATGQRLPLQGQHPEHFRGAWLEHFRTEPSTAPLDMLLARATALLPSQRIAMAEFETELFACLSPPQGPSTPENLSDLGPLLVDPYRRVRDELAVRAETLKKLSEIVRLAADSLGVVENSLRTLGPDAVVNGACISSSPQHIGALGRGFDSNRLSCAYVSLLGPGEFRLICILAF
jgi:serine/threonine protein kinase